jgi:hypothetical protein
VSVAPSVWHGQSGRAGSCTRGADGAVLTELELSRAARKAVALAQQEKSAWIRADVIKYLARVLPRTGLDPAAVAVLLEDLADRALASEFEPVTCVELPAWSCPRTPGQGSTDCGPGCRAGTRRRACPAPWTAHEVDQPSR